MGESFSSKGSISRQQNAIGSRIRSAIDSIRERVARVRNLGDPLTDEPLKKKDESVKFTIRGRYP